MVHLDLFVPEWQGYGESNETMVGAHAALRAIDSSVGFVHVPIATEERLDVECGILGRAAVVRNLAAVRSVLDETQPHSVFTVGGTCAVEVAPVSYLNRLRDGRLAVVWCDAHADLNTPQSSPTGHFHGMPLRSLLGDGDEEVVLRSYSQLDPEQIFLVGARDIDPAEAEFIRERGIRVFSGGTLANAESLVSCMRDGGFEAVYLHVDLDVLDPSEFPHVLLPIQGGLETADLDRMIDALVDVVDVAGSSLLEFVPRGRTGSDYVAALARKLRAPTMSA